jgi:hypothetical protein
VTAPSFPERSALIRRTAGRLCLRLGWAPLHEMTLRNGRRADIMALRPDGGFACIEIKSGLRDFLTDSKWPEYRAYADALYFAVDQDFPIEILPAEAGLIVAAGLEAELLREPQPHPWPRLGGRPCCGSSLPWRPGDWRRLRTPRAPPIYVPPCDLNKSRRVNDLLTFCLHADRGAGRQ